MKTRKRILCVGLVCVDIIQVCSSYPEEDSDQRCLEQYWQRGGNCSNVCTVLSQLGAENEFFGTISSGMFCQYLKEDFESHAIEICNCVFHDDCDTPLSTILINSQNGSRTIVHSNKNLPELTIHDFRKLDLSHYSWIHFEGRNIDEVKQMMESVTEWRTQNKVPLRISVELEKPRAEQQILIGYADVVFIGKDFATFKGYHSMQETIEGIKPLVRPETVIISAWGEMGAAGYSLKEGFVCSPASKQPNTVDTLGAGDTFCAAILFSLNQGGHGLNDSIRFGCQVAGAKVAIRGFTGLNQVANTYLVQLQTNTNC